MGYQLRDYQTYAVQAIERKLSLDRYALCVLGTGLGKSITLTETVKKRKRAVILQPSIELVNQNYNKLVVAGLEGVRICTGTRKDWDSNYIYTTPQSLYKMVDVVEEPELLVIDEAHLFFNGTMFQAILKEWKNCKVAGQTATPYYQHTYTRRQKNALYSVSETRSIEQDLYGDAVCNFDRSYGEQHGWLPKIEDYKLKYVPYIKPSHYKDEGTYRELLEEHRQNVAVLLLRLRNSIIFCSSIAQANYLSTLPNTRTLFGSTPTKERLHLINDFKAGEVKHLLTVGCLKLGFDFPELENVLALDNIPTPTVVEQTKGRLSRGTCKKRFLYAGRVNFNKPQVGYKQMIRIK